MVEFSEDETANPRTVFQHIVNTVAEKAIKGELDAAATFATVVRAQTDRDEFLAAHRHKARMIEENKLTPEIQGVLTDTDDSLRRDDLTQTFERILNAVAAKASDRGDLKAAQVFAALLDAQTRHDEFLLRQDKRANGVEGACAHKKGFEQKYRR